MSTDLGITKLDSPFWTRIQSEIDEVAPRDNPKEEEIWDCAVGRKYQAYSLWIWCRCNSRDFPAYTEKSKLWPLWWNTIRSGMLVLVFDPHEEIWKLFFLKKKKKSLGHTAACTTETLTKLGYTLLPHPSPNPTVLILHHQIFTISVFGKTACSDNITWTRRYRTPCSNGEQILPVGSIWSCVRVEEGFPKMESVLKNCYSFSNVVARFLKFSHV